MKILIVGNGFDLAHKLPTQYADFLNVCSMAKSKEIRWIDDKPELTRKNSNEENVLKEFAKSVGHELYLEFKKKVRNCFWIDHFLTRRTLIGEKWLNFEEEIKIVVESVIKDMKDAPNEIVYGVTNVALHNFCNANSFYAKNKTFRDLFDLIMDEHKKLTRLLEIYMCGYVEKTEIEKKTLFVNLLVDKVLSFNYTNTYVVTYDYLMECCYIHGEADADRKDTCNMVLGFDDHYMDGVRVVPELVPFEKYCQRIVNRTDSRYFEWIERMKEEQNTVYIFGHSLAPADGDVLAKFILSPNTKTQIYYRDEIDRAEKIRNLAIILGPDHLIQLTGGEKPAILFQKTK